MVKLKRPPALTFDEAERIIREINSDYGTERISLDILPKIVKSKPTSSLFQRKVSALKKFGLIESTDNDQVMISSRGMQVIAPTETGEDVVARESSILNIELISELSRRYPGGNLPKKETLSNILQRQYQIPPKFVDDWLSFIESSFNSLESKDKAGGMPVGEFPGQGLGVSREPGLSEQGSFVLKLPISTGSIAELYIPRDATEEDRNMLKSVIDALHYKDKEKD